MQRGTKLTRTLCTLPARSPFVAIAAGLLLCLGFSAGAMAQSVEVPESSTATAVIPQQVRYAGALSHRAGETVEAVFRIYAAAEGGDALWTETQRVPVSADGTYAVVLGAASEKGLPQAVFAGGQARWVGVTVDRAEEVRSPLSSVAYAMKAGDAETVGGLAAANLATKDDLAKLTQSVVTTVQSQTPIQETTPTGSGTTDYVPLWTASGTLGNSGIFQAASGFVGIGTTSPGGPLELATNATGGANATLMLEQTNGASGNYYADLGLYNSKGLIGNLSALGAGYPAGQLFGPNDVVFLGGQQNATTNLIFTTNTSGALKFGTGGFAVANERMRIGAAGGISVGNAYVGTDPGAGNFIVSGKVGVGTKTPAAVLEVNGTAKFDGLITFASGQTFPGASGGTITGITTTSPLTGGGTSGSIGLGLNESTLVSDITPSLETNLNGVYAQLNSSNTFNAGQTFEGATTISGYNQYGTMLSVSNNGYDYSSAISATNIGNYGTGIYVSPGPGGYGVDSVGTQSAGSAAVLGYLDGGSGQSNAFYLLESTDGLDAGVWGDAPTGQTAGVIGSADNAYAGIFYNNSPRIPTISVVNQFSEGPTGLVKSGIGTVLRAGGPGGMCGISQMGNLSCTGQVKTLVSTEGGARQVETYAVQSAENWVEDYGSGQLSHGGATIQVEPGFAATVNTGLEFHVFLTPGGDCKGLYVSHKTNGSFEVHELGGGTSSIPFDYKIVAKRRGVEGQRLVDVTTQMKAETDAATPKKLAQPLPIRGKHRTTASGVSAAVKR